MCAAYYLGDAVCCRRVHCVAVTVRVGADDSGLRRNIRHIWSDPVREQDGNHVHTNCTCTGSEDSFQRHGSRVLPDNLFPLLGRRRHLNFKSVERDRPAYPSGVNKLHALHAGAVRPPEGKSAASEGPDGKTRGSSQ